MSENNPNNFPKLHNAMWPGLVGKGSPGAEPCISLDQMLELTAAASVNGTRFDGVDLFLFDPHVSIDSSDDAIKGLAEKVAGKGFVIGSVVAPVWGPTGGGSAMGSSEDRARFVGQVRKACRIAQRLRQLGVRPYGVVRIDSASGVEDWSRDAEGNQGRIAETFREACKVAEEFGERLAAEGEICWGGMHSWKKMLDLLERVNRPQTLGFQADMAHTLLYTMGYNEPGDALLPADWDWSEPGRLDAALKQLTSVLRPWTIDFHVAQNDATVHGSGTHDKTGHHCLPEDPGGKLRIVEHAGYWLRSESGTPTKAIRHLCWDGCMFPNEVMMRPQTWNEILATMIAVREAHGWFEGVSEVSTKRAAPGGVQLQTAEKPTQPRPRGTARKSAPARIKKRAAKRTKRAPNRPVRKQGKKTAKRAKALKARPGARGKSGVAPRRRKPARVHVKAVMKAKSRKARQARKRGRRK